MSKWNEKLVTNFLKMYKRHPCLWNPYDKDYYNCKEKNEALQKIIDDLGTPGFTVNDYLQQIKLIREKYKKEQSRTIKGLQSQKQYKSPFSWYNIVADMLRKVISDEETMNVVSIVKTTPPDTSVLKSLSSDNIRYPRKDDKSRIRPCTDATCDAVARKSKSARLNIKFTPSKTNESRSNTRTRYILCPRARNTSKSSGEHAVSNYKSTRNVDSKVTEYTVPYNSINSTPTNSERGSTKKYDPPFLNCPLCGWESAKYKSAGRNVEKSKQEKRTLTTPTTCTNYSRDAPKLMYTRCSGCSKDVTHAKDLSKSAPLSSVMSKLPKSDVGVQSVDTPQTQVVQIEPNVTNQLEGGTIEACTRFKITLPDSKLGRNATGTPSICYCTQGVQCLKPDSCAKWTQLSAELKTDDAHTNTVNYREQGIQSTVCMSNGTRRCASIQTLNQMEEKQVGESKIGEDSKDFGINTIGRTSKGIQSAVCVSRGNLVCSSFFERMKDVGTTPSIHKIRSSSCIMSVNFKSIGTDSHYVSPIQVKSHGSINRSIQHTDFSEAATGETQVYARSCNTETCPRNVSELMKDPTVVSVLQQFLCKMLSSKVNGVSRCIKAQTNYEQKNSVGCTTDAVEMVKKIKEFADMTIGTSLSKDEWIQTLADAEISTVGINKRTMTEDGSCKAVYRSIGVQGDEKNRTSISKEAKKLTYADKEICTHTECRDIGISGSLSQFRDVGIQNGSLDGTVCTNKLGTDTQMKITVGTQKRDPILVRVIKCPESQTINKSDKETTTVGTEGDLEKKRFNKRVEICGRSTCVPYTVCRRSKENSEPACQKGHEYQVECDYRERSYADYHCDKNCKGKTYCNQDWTDITNADAFDSLNSSKIPLCVKPARKCTFTKSK